MSADSRSLTIRLASAGVALSAGLHWSATTDSLPDTAPVGPDRRTADWWSTTPTEQLLGGVARLVVMCVLGYLLMVTVTQLIALLAPRTRLARLADRLAPRALAIVTAGVIAAGSPTAGAESLPSPAGPTGNDGAVMEVIETADSEQEQKQEPELQPVAGPVTYVVARGDHLWSIAERAVSLDGSTADDATVALYWRALIDLNRHRLVDPDDPDLILPGQQLELPLLSPNGGR